MQDVKNAVDSNTKNSNQKHSEKTLTSRIKKREIDSIINSARNITELFVLLIELQYHREFKVFSCILRVNQTTFKTLKDNFRETKKKDSLNNNV